MWNFHIWKFVPLSLRDGTSNRRLEPCGALLATVERVGVGCEDVPAADAEGPDIVRERVRVLCYLEL